MIGILVNGLNRILKVLLPALQQLTNRSSKSRGKIDHKTHFSSSLKKLLLLRLGVAAMLICVRGDCVHLEWQEIQHPPNISQKTAGSKPAATYAPIQADNFHVAFTVVNVHRSPSTYSERVTQALHGEPVRVLKEQNGWVKVELPTQSDYSGWVNQSVLKNIPIAQNWLNLKIIAVRYAEMLKLPSKNAEVLLKLPLGTVVASEPDQTDSQFTAIKLVDGQKGYVSFAELLDYTERDVSQVSRTEILTTARQLLGVPYLWGGMTTSGVDCSGFVHTVFKVHGIRLHRDADLQYYHDGVPVARDKLESGDLVFFETYQSGPSHVGIYVGNRKFLQVSSSRGVSYGSLEDPYFSKHFLGAKRIIHN
jgi:gamma-D-glutamyl-L-lysine dipeptidyl-peptidase